MSMSEKPGAWGSGQVSGPRTEWRTVMMPPAPKKITLLATGLGLYSELEDNGSVLDVTWVRDCYTEPRGPDFDCASCGKPITEWELWTCLDGGDTAHEGCVTIHQCEPEPGSVWDAEGLWATTATQAAGKVAYPLRAKCGTHAITRDKDTNWRLA